MTTTKPKRVVFVLPVLAPYAIPRFRELGMLGEIDLHIMLESNSFSERPGWVHKEIPGCTVHVLWSLKKTKKQYDKELDFKEEYTKAIPLSLPFALLRLKPDAVIMCNPTQVLMALPVKLLLNIKFGLILEDTPLSQINKHPAIQYFRRSLYRFIDFTFCFSEDAKQYARELPIATPHLRSSWSIDSSWLKITRKQPPNERIQFLFVGQLNARKGIMPLLEAWRQLMLSRSINSELILVGDGPLKKQAESYLQEHNISNVIITGQLEYNSVRSYYETSDVFILPTMQDLFSLVVTEAMGFGLPILTSIYNGARELVSEGENGFIFDPNSQDDIVSTLNKTIERHADLPAMGKKSREIISRYTHQQVMQRMQNDLLRVLS